MFLFLSLNAIAVCLYRYIPKKLNPFQVVGAWLITVIYHDEWLTIVSVNLELIKTTTHLGAALVIGLNRLLLYPLCSVFFLEVYARARTLWQKGGVYATAIIGSLLLQYTNQLVGFYNHREWAAWWSIIVWGCSLVLLVGTNKWIMSLVKKAEWE